MLSRSFIRERGLKAKQGYRASQGQTGSKQNPHQGLGPLKQLRAVLLTLGNTAAPIGLDPQGFTVHLSMQQLGAWTQTFTF